MLADKMKFAAKGRVDCDSRGTLAANDRIVGDQNELLPAMIIMIIDRIVCDQRAAKDRMRIVIVGLCRESDCRVVGPLATTLTFCRLLPPMIELISWRSDQDCRQCAKDRIVGNQG